MASKAFDPQNTTRLVSFTLRATKRHFTSTALVGPSSLVLPSALLRKQLDYKGYPLSFKARCAGMAMVRSPNRLGSTG